METSGANWEERFVKMQERYLQALTEGRRGYIPLEFIDCSETENYLELAVNVDPDLRNHSNNLHGGLCATLFDVTMGFTLNLLSGVDKAVTAELQSSFLRPIPVGTRLHLRGYLQSAGRNIAHLRCEAFEKENPGRILASGTGVFFLFR